ncbi:MAG: hypothetical protein KDE33_09445, partial [Bacteroidetes bacterium]|nr:hypothetical protein [Bacteroidota bacterium]
MSIETKLTTEISREIFQRAFEILNNTKTKSDFISKLPESKALSRQQVINKLIDCYEKENLVLVLGAGVSMGFGLPNWDTLLQKLMITTIEQEQ